MQLINVRHAWPEKRGFSISRKNGLMYIYTFLHFWKPVKIVLDGKEIVTEPDAVIVYGRNVPQYFSSPDSDLLHDWFHVQGDDVEEALAAAGLKLNTIYYPKGCGFITDIVKSLEFEFFGSDEFTDRIVTNYVSNLFFMIARRLTGGGSDERVIDVQTQNEIKNLRTRMFSDLDRDWSVARMAEEVNMSESRFFVLYKSIFNTTPNRDLIRARMDLAKQLLAQNNQMLISDVATKCGYFNEFHFIRQFKKYVGMTPKKYALLHRS